jgi:ubiquinone biosynthesis monooxygenase Coq7
VSANLQNHLSRLPIEDTKSRLIVEQMQQDEIHHGDAATKAGAKELPTWVKKIMQLHGKIMTLTAHYF